METAHRPLKGLVWLYFALLLGEGALRKWILPSLSGPLLVVRDPVVIALFGLALARGVFPANGLVVATGILAVVATLASLIAGGPFFVTLYGVRADFLHLPVVFLIPRLWDARDVERVGRWVLWLVLPMTLLAIAQFRAGPDAWLNAGAGGELGGQLYAAEGRIRPPGVFSFVNGMVAFLALAAAFVLGAFLERSDRGRWLRLVAVPALLLALAVSGSRAAVMAVTAVFTMAVVVCLRGGKQFLAMLRPLVLVYAAYLVLSWAPVFREGLEVTGGRFSSAGGVRAGVVDRFFGNLSGVVDAAVAAPLLGHGLGMGTNAGAGLLQGERGFLLAEDEWSRVVLESGPVLGFAYIGLRLAILVAIARVGFRALRSGNPVPLLLLGASGFGLMVGQFGQPTEAGFAVFGAGLALAAARRDGLEGVPPARPASGIQAGPALGRAPAAARLHTDVAS